MNQSELALEQHEENFDFFRTQQKHIQTDDFKTRPKNDDGNHNNPKILVQKLLLILILPGLAFTAIYAGTYLGNTVWEKATGTRIEKEEKTKSIPYYTYIMHQNKLDKERAIQKD